MTSKRLTSKSGITIPKDIRLLLGWQPEMSVDMDTTVDGGLILRPHVDRCRFCGSIENVRKYKGNRHIISKDRKKNYRLRKE